MPQDTPQPQPWWIPSRDYLGRRPIVETWPGLRKEIKRTWAALAKASQAARVAATRGEWQHFLGVSPSSLMRHLCTLQGIGLIRVTAGGDGNQRLTLELIDPATVERIPVGTAAAVRVRPPRAGCGSFERQAGLFAEPGPPSLRIATPEGEEPEELSQAEPVPDVAPQAEPVVGPQPEPVPVIASQPEPVIGPQAEPVVPQCPAGAGALDLIDLNEMIIESKEGEAEVESRESRVEPSTPDSGPSTLNSRLSTRPPGPPAVDPIEALTAEDFQKRQDEIAEKADRIACRLWRVDQRGRMTAEEKTLLVKACLLASAQPCPPYGWTWLDDAVDRVSRSKSRKKLDHPAGYLHQVLRQKVTAAGRDFPNDLAVLESIVHRDLFSQGPPPRASPAPASIPPTAPAPMTPEQIAEALSVTATARAAMKTARALAAKEASQNPSPKNPSPNPWKETP